jgi:hypothetical protein
MMESPMTQKIATIATIATVALVALGCGRSGKMHRGQQQYDVVQEGSASGVTSTINGPGETTARATDTSADTTTNFTLPTNPNPLGNDTAGLPVMMDTAGSATAPMPKKKHVPSPETDTSATTATTDTAATTTSHPPPSDTTGTQG